MYEIKSSGFSNKKLRIFYPWLIKKLLDIDKKLARFDHTIEMIKNRFSYPYNKAKIRASSLNNFRDIILAELSGTHDMFSPHRKNFMQVYNVSDICEGCKYETIQEEAHIVMDSHLRSHRISNLRGYKDHYANIWLLCGTCHNLVDKRSCWNKASTKRIKKLISNLEKHAKLQKLMYESLKRDCNFLTTIDRELREINMLDEKRAVPKISKLMKLYGV